MIEPVIPGPIVTQEEIEDEEERESIRPPVIEPISRPVHPGTVSPGGTPVEPISRPVHPGTGRPGGPLRPPVVINNNYEINVTPEAGPVADQVVEEIRRRSERGDDVVSARGVFG